MREAMLTLGTLLLFGGGLMAIAATTPMGAGALIGTAQCTVLGSAPMPCLDMMMWAIGIATVIAFAGAALIMRNR